MQSPLNRMIYKVRFAIYHPCLSLVEALKERWAHNFIAAIREQDRLVTAVSRWTASAALSSTYARAGASCHSGPNQIHLDSLGVDCG